MADQERREIHSTAQRNIFAAATKFICAFACREIYAHRNNFRFSIYTITDVGIPIVADYSLDFSLAKNSFYLGAV